MAMTPQERDKKRRKKETKVGIEDLRMKAGQGTRQALAEIMEWPWPKSWSGPRSRKTVKQ